MKANTTQDLTTMSIAALATMAALRSGQKRRNSSQVKAEAEIVSRIENSLQTNSAAVVRALELLHSKQTADERVCRSTHKTNGVGFSQADAGLGSWLVDTVIKEGRSKGRSDKNLLRGKALDLGRRVTLKYTKTQLLTAAYKKVASSQKETPLYTHDCTHCTFLGTYNNHDLYFCGDMEEVIARFGSDGPDYYSLAKGMKTSNKELNEARKRAFAK